MTRFNGRELYPIVSAKWHLYRDDAGRMNLWLEARCGEGRDLDEDTPARDVQPSWELNLVEPAISDEELIAGFRASIPSCYDETRDGWITMFYYFEHEGSDENTIEILAREFDRMRIRLTATIPDVDYYDASKVPRSRIELEAWFELDAYGRRSMA